MHWQVGSGRTSRRPLTFRFRTAVTVQRRGRGIFPYPLARRSHAGAEKMMLVLVAWGGQDRGECCRVHLGSGWAWCLAGKSRSRTGAGRAWWIKCFLSVSLCTRLLARLICVLSILASVGLSVRFDRPLDSRAAPLVHCHPAQTQTKHNHKHFPRHKTAINLERRHSAQLNMAAAVCFKSSHRPDKIVETQFLFEQKHTPRFPPSLLFCVVSRGSGCERALYLPWNSSASAFTLAPCRNDRRQGKIFRAFDLYLKCLFLTHSYPFSSSSEADGVFFLFTMSSEILESKTWGIWTYSKRKRGQAKSSSPGCCSYWGSTPRSATGRFS